MALLGANKRKWSVCKRAGTREVTQKHSKLMPKVILALFIMMPVRASHNTSQAHFVELCLTYVLAFFFSFAHAFIVAAACCRHAVAWYTNL